MIIKYGAMIMPAKQALLDLIKIKIREFSLYGVFTPEVSKPTLFSILP